MSKVIKRYTVYKQTDKNRQTSRQTDRQTEKSRYTRFRVVPAFTSTCTTAHVRGYESTQNVTDKTTEKIDVNCCKVLGWYSKRALMVTYSRCSPIGQRSVILLLTSVICRNALCLNVLTLKFQRKIHEILGKFHSRFFSKFPVK